MKKPFVTKEQLEEIIKTYPTPFHIYDEKGIRENARKLKQAFAWNKGFKEYFAVKATPNPFLINILREYGCGCDCSSLTELMLQVALLPSTAVPSTVLTTDTVFGRTVTLMSSLTAVPSQISAE